MKGRCNCGSVTFTISGNLPAIYQCHCSLCQRQSGAGASAATIIYVENFVWNSDIDAIGQWKKQSGFNSHFCKECGSPVPNSIGSQYMWIPMGLINNAKTSVAAHLWLGSKPGWELPHSAVRNYQEMPADLEEFIQFLNSPPVN